MELHDVRQKVLHDLQTLPEAIEYNRKKYLDVMAEYERTKFVILNKRYHLLQSGEVIGPNEDMRSSGVWMHTEEIETHCMDLKIQYESLRSEHAYLKLKLESAQYIVKLLTES